jgi:hypothetical protein
VIPSNSGRSRNLRHRLRRYHNLHKCMSLPQFEENERRVKLVFNLLELQAQVDVLLCTVVYVVGNDAKSRNGKEFVKRLTTRFCNLTKVM